MSEEQGQPIPVQFDPIMPPIIVIPAELFEPTRVCPFCLGTRVLIVPVPKQYRKISTVIEQVIACPYCARERKR